MEVVDLAEFEKGLRCSGCGALFREPLGEVSACPICWQDLDVSEKAAINITIMLEER